LVHIAGFLAQLKQMNLADFAKAVTATSKVFFNLM
jgi:Tat protein secretion system quality control protein TatD with DNase activity